MTPLVNLLTALYAWADRNLDTYFACIIGVLFLGVVVYGLTNAVNNHIAMMEILPANERGDGLISILRTVIAWGLLALLALAILAWL